MNLFIHLALFYLIFLVSLLVTKLELPHNPIFLRVVRIARFSINSRLGRPKKHGESYLRS